MSDFNVRNNFEQIYVNSPDVTNLVDVFLQEIDIMFNTTPYDVLGQNDFGLDIESKLWKTNIRGDLLSAEIDQAIRSNCMTHEYFDFTIDVKFMKGISKDIGVIDVIVKEGEFNDVERPLTFIYR